MWYLCTTLLQPAVFSEAIQSIHKCRSSSRSIAGSTNSCRWNDETCVSYRRQIRSHGQVRIFHLIVFLLFNLQICGSTRSDQNLLTAAIDRVPVKAAHLPVPTSWKCNVKLVDRPHANSFVGWLVLCYHINNKWGSWWWNEWILVQLKDGPLNLKLRLDPIVIYLSFYLTLPVCYIACGRMKGFT